MKIALCSSYVPFVQGGATTIVDNVAAVLQSLGHEVEKIYLPHVDSPDLLLQQMATYRWLDLSAADRIICFRPPAHAIPHSHKVLWFIHHIRAFYDLWDCPYRGFPDTRRNRETRAALHAADTRALEEAQLVLTNSRVVSDRLRRFNGVESEVLYPPLYQPDRFQRRGFNDEVICVSRIVPHKRQHLLVEAMKHTRTPVRLRLCGACPPTSYQEELQTLVDQGQLSERVALNVRWVDEAEKSRLLADCLAAAYVPFDEDSYGYFTLEAGWSGKAVITTADSGGILELINDGQNGIVTDPTPQSIAQAMDRLFLDRAAASQMGDNAIAQIRQLKIDWNHVIDTLLR